MLPPQRRGKGRGKGVPGLWSRQQADLLRTLCMFRDKHKIHKVAVRCNIPVWVWLYWGDEWSVTLDQVKRVMKKWASYQRSPSQEQSRQGARELVKEVANHKDGGPQQAVRELANILYNGTESPQAIHDSLYYVYDKDKPANGPQDIPILPESVVLYLELLMEAIYALETDQEIPDIHWEWARHFQVYELSQYTQQQQKYAQETRGSSVEHIFSLLTMETLWATACQDLAVVLGLGLKYPSVPGVPDTLRLDVWKKQVRSATVRSKRVISPIMLPDGSHPQSLQIIETVTLLQSEEDQNRGS